MDISIEWFNDNSGFMAFIAAMVALLVGIIAAGISIWNTLITQRGLRLQYQPELLIKTNQEGSTLFLTIENIGSGTAYQIKYNRDFVDFINEWTDRKKGRAGNTLIDSLSLGTLKSGVFKEYHIIPKYVEHSKTIESKTIEIEISYTDIFKKFKGETNHCCKYRR